ncbi:hypothetical protein OKW45_006994 [Paraburkholderia sp. WSM4175]|uniref:hypothetical protein n=1 Tax=Paraburkholderia sp. WSM4175 TaxID=2991072 RepID=UPI003D1A0ACF
MPLTPNPGTHTFGRDAYFMHGDSKSHPGSASNALPRNTATALKVVDPVEGDSHILAISRVCGIPFIDDAPKNYKAKALHAVSAVTTANPHIKARCLDALRKS